MTEQQSKIYPNLEDPHSQHRFSKILQQQTEIRSELDKYRLLLKKASKIKRVFDVFEHGCSSIVEISAIGTVSTAASGVGIIAAIPLGGIGTASGVSAVVFKSCNERFIKRKEKYMALAAVWHTDITGFRQATVKASCRWKNNS